MRGLADAAGSTVGVRSTLTVRGFRQRSSRIGLLSINISCLFPPRGVVLRGPPCKYMGLWSQLHAVSGEWVCSRRQEVQAGSNAVKVWGHSSGFRESGAYSVPTLVQGGEACPPED